MDKLISKVSDAAIIAPARGIASGCVVTFICDENVVKDDKIKIIFENKTHYFNVHSISITGDKKLEVKANEVGYWATKFEKKDNFDLRSILELEVTLIKDPETIKTIHTQSCWC